MRGFAATSGEKLSRVGDVMVPTVYVGRVAEDFDLETSGLLDGLDGAARTERAGDLVLRARKRCDVTHAKDPQATARWYDELRKETGDNIIRGIVGNIMGGPLTPIIPG